MKYLYFLLALLIFVGCKKENTNSLDGIYTGVFEAYSGNRQLNTDIEILFSANRFEIKKGLKIGSGTFTLLDSTTVEFKDENTWTADFDTALILEGSYKYEIKGNSLILTKYVMGGSCDLCKDLVNNRYQYSLKK